MNKFLRYLAILVIIFFEVYAGVRLLTAPAEFSNSAIVIFGIFSLIIGVVMLYYAITFKQEYLPYRLGLALGILNVILGLFCVAFSQKVVEMFPVFAVIYGVVMVFAGIDKLGNYFIIKSRGLPHHWIWMVGAVLTIVLGIVIIANPFTTVEATYTFGGIFLIASGVVDLFAFIFSFFF